ncbi:MAG: rhomboid family intramembrane serine protease [Pleurocapsa sp.]
MEEIIEMKYNGNKIAYATYLIIVINLLFYAVEIKLGGSTNDAVLDFLGALIPEKVDSGEWWRLIAANFLHYGTLHLVTNMLSLYVLGRLVELILGVKSFLIIYLLSGTGAMFLFSEVALKTGEPVFLVGASAAIMGLVGTILSISLQVWLKKRNSINAKRLRLVILIIGLQFVFDNLIPQVSFLGHLFGLIVGFLVGSFFVFWKFNFESPFGN